MSNSLRLLRVVAVAGIVFTIVAGLGNLAEMAFEDRIIGLATSSTMAGIFAFMPWFVHALALDDYDSERSVAFIRPMRFNEPRPKFSVVGRMISAAGFTAGFGALKFVPFGWAWIAVSAVVLVGLVVQLVAIERSERLSRYAVLAVFVVEVLFVGLVLGSQNRTINAVVALVALVPALVYFARRPAPASA